MTKTTILYCRVSKEEQADALPAQRRRLEQRADAEGWTDVVAVEEAGSATEKPVDPLSILADKLDTGRPKLNQIIENARSGKVARIVVDDLNRLARDGLERRFLARLLRQLGVDLIALSMPKTGNPLGDLYADEAKAMADTGHKFQLGLDVRRGRDATAAEGRHQTRPPFGYALEPMRDERGDFVLDGRGRRVNQVILVPDEAEAVRMVFDRYSQGWSMNKLAQELNARGFHTRQPMKRTERDERGDEIERRYPRPFARTSIREMLTNEFYVQFAADDPDRRGTIIRTRHATSGPHECQACDDGCPTPCLVHCTRSRYRGQHPALITRALFETCAAQAAERKPFEHRVKRNNGKDFLLWGLLRCVACDGKFYTFKEWGGYAYYRHRPATGCEYDDKMVPKARIDAEAHVLVMDDLTAPLEVERRWALVQQLRQESRLTTNRQVAEKRIKELETERGQVLHQHKKKWITDAKAESEIAVIDRQIEALRPRADAPPPVPLRDSFAAWRQQWLDADVERRRELLGTLVQAVYIDPALYRPTDRRIGFYVDLTYRLLFGIRPTPDFADYYEVGAEGRADVDWLSWRVGEAAAPPWTANGVAGGDDGPPSNEGTPPAPG